MSDAVTYPSYLALDELLSLQRPRSRPEHPDELLFIVVHQSSELWFKVILRDLDTLANALERREAGLALWQLQRVNGLMRIVSAQLSSLALLPPQHFAAFRTNLGTSSGSQSVQFRAIEAASGLREDWFIDLVRQDGKVAPEIQRWLDRPSLQEIFLEFLRQEGTSLEELLGLTLNRGALRINPCIPKTWPRYEAVVRTSTAEFHLVVENPDGSVSLSPRRGDAHVLGFFVGLWVGPHIRWNERR